MMELGNAVIPFILKLRIFFMLLLGSHLVAGLFNLADLLG